MSVYNLENCLNIETVNKTEVDALEEGSKRKVVYDRSNILKQITANKQRQGIKLIDLHLCGRLEKLFSLWLCISACICTGDMVV